MSIRVVLSQEQVTEMLAFLDQQLARGACDHTRHLTLRWAQQVGVDTGDLIDALDDSGGFCDCEVLMNVESDVDLVLSIPHVSTPAANPWCLPPPFQPPPADHLFTKVLRGAHREQANCYSADGDLLVPAPKGAKARRRVRKSVHFFVGLADGLPNEVGFVTLADGVTAPGFAKQVRDSAIEELAAFTDRDSAFFLSRLADHPADTPVASHFMEVTGLSGKQPDQLRIHKVILRRK